MGECREAIREAEVRYVFGPLIRAYPNNPEALKAMRAQAKWRNAR
jgi:hypothetical protein